MIGKDSQGLSALAYRHMKSPFKFGEMRDANCVGIGGNQGNGPFVRIFLKIEGNLIKDVAFQTYTCPWAMAIGSLMCERIIGKDLSAANALTAEDLESGLGGVPRNRKDLTQLAISALRMGLSAAGR